MKVTFEGPWNHSTRRKFWFIQLLPTLELVVDSQQLKKFVHNGEVYGGYREFSLGFGWLLFMFYINVEINVH